MAPEEVEALEAVLAGRTAARGVHGRARVARALAPSSLHRLEKAGALLDLRGVAVHLVDADHDLLHTQQVDQTGVLAGLTLDLTSLVVTTAKILKKLRCFHQ